MWLYELLNLIALTATLCVLIWYTIETYKLRLAAQKQLESSNMPIIALEYSGPFCSDETGHSLLPMFVCNCGTGPAFNVRLGNWRKGETARIFEPITFVQHGDKAQVHDEYRIGTLRLSEPTDILCLSYFLAVEKEGPDAPRIFGASLEYEDSTGKTHVSLHKVVFEPRNQTITTTFKSTGILSEQKQT
jgi:hypothetical protein